MGESANWENREQVWYEPGRTWEGQREAIRIAGGVRGGHRGLILPGRMLLFSHRWASRRRGRPPS